MKRIHQKLSNAFQALEKGHLKQAEILYLGCLDQIEKQDSDEFKQALHGLAYVKSEQEQFTEASDLYGQLLELALQSGSKQDEAIALHQLGVVQRLNQQFMKALHLFQSEQAIYEQDNSTYSLERVANFYEQARTFLSLEKLAEAEDWMKQSLHAAEEAKDSLMIGYSYSGLGDVAIKQNDQTKARHYLAEAKQYFEQMGHAQGMKNVEHKQSNLH